MIEQPSQPSTEKFTRFSDNDEVLLRAAEETIDSFQVGRERAEAARIVLAQQALERRPASPQKKVELLSKRLNHFRLWEQELAEETDFMLWEQELNLSSTPQSGGQTGYELTDRSR